ncbi:MAG: tRNA pseudouridine(55) synthase TruB [Hyphomonadaceae bacterium]|nr:tRNA pseudouridine(55) synthase TruB [Hyphomonadaceae bacterium]
MSRKKKGEPVHGWLVLDKPEDVTSTQAVGICRRVFNAQKAGHGGTLDPLASGILPIAFGEATKTVGYVMEADKEYVFTVKWGSSTTTQDREGAVTGTSDVRPSREAIAEALKGFVGTISQVPPQYSAIKVNGERAYDLARDGETVELAARQVVVHEAVLRDCPSEDEAAIFIRCGKGFYIRALVRDLAGVLGAEAHVSKLRRTRVGAFAEDAAIQLSILQQMSDKAALDDRLIPLETALDDIPALAVTGEEASRLRQGREIVLLPHQVEAFREMRHSRSGPSTVNGEDASRICLATERCGDEDLAVALGEVRAGRFMPVRVFNQD